MPPECNLSTDSDRESVLSLKELLPKPRRNSTGPKYFCKFEGCNLSFKRLDHLDRHEFHHTGVKKHACTYDGCDKVYSILTHLKRHLRSKHERTEPKEKCIPCTIKDCDKMFQSTCNMQRHVREVHENPKVYTCVYCSERFSQKLKMRRHEITKHTGEYPFNCEKCSKGFYQLWQYEKHIPSCKVYPCHDCSAQFDKWTSYLKHCKDMQHGRKYYKCEHCERVYAKPGELQRHVMLKHISDELVLNFKCTHEGCERVYAYERNLRQHVKVAHSGKRFECQEEGCQRFFSSTQNLAKHLKRDHAKRKREESCSDHAVNQRITQTKPQRKKRKDAGTSATSNLALLTGISVHRQFDKLLCAREAEALTVISTELLKCMDEEQTASEAENCSKGNQTDLSIESKADGFTTKEKRICPPQTNDDTELNSMLAIVLQE